MLVIDDVSLRVAGRLLIERSTVQIPDGARVGLIGRNGTGKSSLFRAIAGDIAVEHGGFAYPARAAIGRLPQECLFVGDRYDIDLRLPAEMGCAVFLVSNTEELFALCKLMNEENI